MKVAIVNYGLGNLASVRRAFDDLGAEASIAERPAALLGATRLVLPGVGAFSEGMRRLKEGGWIEPIKRMIQDEHKPLLGICLGMQLLADTGEEGGGGHGLGLIKGNVRRLDGLGCRLRVPQVGWNDVAYTMDEPLFARIPQHSDFYFVHSYAFQAVQSKNVIAVTDYGVPVAAAIRNQHVFGTQFHPEKSSRAGRQLLQNFLAYASC